MSLSLTERRTEARTIMEVLDPRVGMAIEHAVAASRWRIAARFEGPQQAERFRRQATLRSAAATELLGEIVKTGRGVETPASLRSAQTRQGG